MYFYLLSSVFLALTTRASCLNDSPDSLASKALTGAASNWRYSAPLSFNQLDVESGVLSRMRQDASEAWHYDFMIEFPGEFQVSMWRTRYD